MNNKNQTNYNSTQLGRSVSSNDFPYYNGLPVEISGLRWLFLMGMVALGFLVLILPIPLFDGTLALFIRVILFLAIPLVALSMVAQKHWRAIFRKVRGRDVLWMIGFALLNFVVSITVAMVVSKLFGTHSNAAVSGLSDLSSVDLGLFFLSSIPQLIGEEVLTILPFLALMYLFFTRMKCSRKSAIIWAWLISSILFGLAHLPTYEWDIIQCIVVIGIARLVLTLPYLLTKNIWVSSGAHILNDWILFTLSILAATSGS